MNHDEIDEAYMRHLVEEWEEYAAPMYADEAVDYALWIDTNKYDCCEHCGIWKLKGAPCMIPGCVPAGMARCPWVATDHGRKDPCRACHNTGYVEAIEDA